MHANYYGICTSFVLCNLNLDKRVGEKSGPCLFIFQQELGEKELDLVIYNKNRLVSLKVVGIVVSLSYSHTTISWRMFLF